MADDEDPVGVWYRHELEMVVDRDEPEGTEQFTVLMSATLLLMLIDWKSERTGEVVEVVSARRAPGEGPRAVTLRTYSRDRVDPDMRARHEVWPYPECVARRGGCPDHPWQRPS